jgi:hypothetical protein
MRYDGPSMPGSALRPGGRRSCAALMAKMPYPAPRDAIRAEGLRSLPANVPPVSAT